MTITFEILIFCERLNEAYKSKSAQIYVFCEATKKKLILDFEKSNFDFFRSRKIDQSGKKWDFHFLKSKMNIFLSLREKEI